MQSSRMQSFSRNKRETRRTVFAYTKMKNNALAFNPTHLIHPKGLNVILLRKRLKCIGVSQTDIEH